MSDPTPPTPTANPRDFPSEEELRPKVDPVTGIDLSLLDDSLRMTVEERWAANDSALNFIKDLRQAVARHYGKP